MRGTQFPSVMLKPSPQSVTHTPSFAYRSTTKWTHHRARAMGETKGRETKRVTGYCTTLLRSISICTYHSITHQHSIFHKHNSHILYYEYTHKHTHSKLSICVTTHTDTHTWTTAHTEESRRQLMLCVHSQRVVLIVVDICWGATTCTHTAITEGAASLHTQSTGSRHKDTWLIRRAQLLEDERWKHHKLSTHQKSQQHFPWPK